VGSKERLCRHLRRFYAERGGLAPIVNMVLLDDVHFCESDQLWSGEVEGVPVAIAWREGDPWVTLYSRNNAPGHQPSLNVSTTILAVRIGQMGACRASMRRSSKACWGSGLVGKQGSEEDVLISGCQSRMSWSCFFAALH
jgi:hypothetical protein